MSICIPDGSISWEFLLHRLSEIFENDCINIEEVEETLSLYKSDPRDWLQYAKFDKYKYTRNLVHEGNGKFNLVICRIFQDSKNNFFTIFFNCNMKSILDGSMLGNW